MVFLIGLVAYFYRPSCIYGMHSHVKLFSARSRHYLSENFKHLQGFCCVVEGNSHRPVLQLVPRARLRRKGVAHMLERSSIVWVWIESLPIRCRRKACSRRRRRLRPRLRTKRSGQHSRCRTTKLPAFCRRPKWKWCRAMWPSVSWFPPKRLLCPRRRLLVPRKRLSLLPIKTSTMTLSRVALHRLNFGRWQDWCCVDVVLYPTLIKASYLRDMKSLNVGEMPELYRCLFVLFVKCTVADQLLMTSRLIAVLYTI